MKFNLSVKTPDGTILIPLEDVTEDGIVGKKIIAYVSNTKYANMLKRAIAGEKINVDSTQRKGRQELTKLKETVRDSILSNCLFEETNGHTPDGTGPHGRGEGPGKGKADGTGLKCKYCGEKFKDFGKLMAHQKKCADARMNY